VGVINDEHAWLRPHDRTQNCVGSVGDLVGFEVANRSPAKVGASVAEETEGGFAHTAESAR
jgi:hypothetical protein